MEEFPSNAVDFWQRRYQQQETPWDIGRVAPPFETLLADNRELLTPGTLAAMGCGYGHDAAFFGQQGFDVTGFDYAPGAAAEATKRYGAWARFVQADIFALPPEYDHQFDYVLEHTCFCAIPPVRRKEYVEVVKRLLKPNGYFLGLIWCPKENDGPPFPSTPEEIKALFTAEFEIQQLAFASNSVLKRKDGELLCLFRSRS